MIIGIILWIPFAWYGIKFFKNNVNLSESSKNNYDLVHAAEKGLNHSEQAQIEKMFLKRDYQCCKCETILLKADIYKDKAGIWCKCRNCKTPNVLI